MYRLYALLVALLPQMVVAESGAPWQGWYLEGSAGSAHGSHDLSYQTLSYQADVYNFDVSGGVYGLAAGYRHQLWHSNWYLGAEVSVTTGSVVGTQQVYMPGVGVAQIQFSSETFATVSATVGYSPHDDWLIYGQAGFAGADMTLRAVAQSSAQTFAFQDRANGWVLGEFAALGVVHQFDSGWYMGSELQWYHFRGQADVDAGSAYPLGQVTAGNEHMAIVVTIGYQF